MQQRAIEKLEYSFCVFTPLGEKELPSLQLITVLWKQTFSVLPIVNCTSLSRPLIGFSPSSWFWYTVFFVLSCYSRVWLFCDPMDCSPPNSSVHGILQARILEWVAKPSSRGLSHPGIKPRSSALQAGSLLSESPGKLTLLAYWFSVWMTSLDVSGKLKSPLLMYSCQFLPLLHIISLYKYILHFTDFG